MDAKMLRMATRAVDGVGANVYICESGRTPVG
jgi:hypothetical protein